MSANAKPVGGFIGHQEGITSIDSCCNCDKNCGHNTNLICSNSKD
jgi:hypothetical protein